MRPPPELCPRCARFNALAAQRCPSEPHRCHAGAHTQHPSTPVIITTARVVDARSHDAYRGEDEANLSSGLVFLGLISLVDPPREGVLEAVDRCRK